MMIVVIKPWQARLLMGLAFALFLAGGYRLSDQAVVSTLSEPPPLDAPLFAVPGEHRMVALTVNVDWGGEQIPSMLTILDQYHAKATFFLTGKWADANRDLARTLVQRGHEVANHGRSHAHPKQLSDQALSDHIAGNTALLGQIVGKVSMLYAPPYGEWDRRIVRRAAQLGNYTVLWTIDTVDWQDPSPATIVNRVVPKAKPGSIVLMHPKPNTVAALPLMLQGLQAKGLQPVTLSELLTAADAKDSPTTTQ